MGFLTPWALGFAALIPGIVALYFLKLRRKEHEVSSTYLWRSVLVDRQANSLWQRLRMSLLLLLQLLVALGLILASAHPFAMVKAGTAGNTVILIDGSGAMQATDLSPNRFEAARKEALGLVDQAPAGARLSLILLARSPQVLVAHATDREAVKRELNAISPTAGDGDLGQSMALAYSLLRGQEDGEIILIGSGQYRGMNDIAPSPVPFRYIPVGTAAPNLAIASFLIRTVDGERMAYAQVANFGPRQVETTVEFWADGGLVAIERPAVAPGATRVVPFPVPAEAAVLEARLPTPDALSLDNRAWVLAGGQQKSRVLLVSEGNPFLLKALQLVSGVEATVVSPADYKPGQYDLYVFDRFLPEEGLPQARHILIDPPSDAEQRFVGKIQARRGDPLLQYVDASEVHVHLARVHEPSADARILWEGETETGLIPLIWAEGDDQVVFAFTLQQSDLPLRVAFPILVQNLTGWLLPPAPVDAPAVQPGESVQLRPWPSATSVTVRHPGGATQSWTVAPGMTPPYLETTLPGLYQVRQQVGGEERTSQFAVNLFSSLVSDLTPAERVAVPVLPDVKPVEAEAPRDLWRYLGWLALAVVAAEWWVYRRGYSL